MTELTKEYFDKAISGLASKADAAATEKRILKRIDEAQEELARIVAETIAEPFTARFDRLEELLTVKDEVQTLKRQMAEIRSALHLTTN
jgi:DNA anti-recombination protein RmuC